MKVLELFAGTRSISKEFEKRGHEVYTVEWDKTFDNIDLYKDIGELTAQEILENFGHPDVIWASPDCSSYSVAAIYHHRRRNKENGSLEPITDYARFCDRVNQHVLELIKELNPRLYFIENPRGGLRKMWWMQDLPRYTVTYCFSGDTKIITKEGHKSFKQLVGKTVEILNINNEWEFATVRKYGKQRLYKLTLSRSKRKKVIYTTKNHRWIVALPKNKYKYYQTDTEGLSKGMLLPYAIPPHKEVEIIPEYVARGFVFGDGHTLKSGKGGAYASFHGEKIEMLPYFDGYGGKRWMDHKGDLQILKMCSLPVEWKTEAPTLDNSCSEIYSWIAGYIAADGSCSSANGQVSMSSSKKQNLEIVKELAESIGIGTYSITEATRLGYGKEETSLYQMTFMRSDIDGSILLRKKHKEAFIYHKNIKHQPRRWSVLDVEETSIYDDVYCCETERTGTFTLEDNVVTHNCKYGESRMKPTDIWTNHPNPKFIPPCKNGDPCHEKAPRGTKCGTQKIKGSKNRAKIPILLCEHIVDICEEYID